jgi:enoyl-[acyl-carrier protein] reductase I
MEITKVYPLDAVFDNLEDVPEDVMDKKNIVYLLYIILV